MLPEPNRFTSFRQYGEFQIRARRPLLELSRVRLAHLVAVVGTDQSQKGEADELALAVTHGAGRGWIHVGEQTGRITRINQILRAFDQAPEVVLARAKRVVVGRQSPSHIENILPYCRYR